ncbi:maltokinase N-terminal cap-like domain-containing protein [Streptomyces huiliensis]|uniref:maltokinase N-terminal cap-like domain-containing protein n=1 Tax=Streptomyces huiliensis TaxID=2876027 RepID=UPI001CBAD91E|nr:phosphotransferase [Streptomyces huiliensis]MBZ4321913.1 phosphotransferase [Streptomyces huiliensis]
MSDAVPLRRETAPGAASPGPAPSGVAAAPPPLPLDTPDRAETLLSSLALPLVRWLPQQRWFAGKGSPVTGLTPVTAVDLLPVRPTGTAPGLIHLLVRARQSGTGSDDCYQLLLGVRPVLPPHLAPALVGRPVDGPLRGLAVYEALADPRLTGLLLERLRVPGRLGPLRFAREPHADLSAGLAPRLLGAEQSNSSVVYGDTYILKLFRRVGPGVNPDLELPRALARTGCVRVPAPAAWFEAEPPDAAEPMTLGVLQPFLPGSADGWRLALDALAAGTGFTDSARALGQATAEVHRALAAALPTVDLDAARLERIAAAMRRRLDVTAEAVPALRPYRDALRAAYDELTRPPGPGRPRHAQRIHGDLHLGQALRTAADGRWSIIDFEGEPARPLAERRRPQPVEQDVAGMLRSFDYAAAVGRAAGTDWAPRAREAYCDGYAAAHRDPREDGPLLHAQETDKAVYEVLYEARHRPDWLPVPLSAIRRLAERADGGRRRP